MPDPLTHLCFALIPKAITGEGRVGPFAVGAILPDIGSRLPGIFLDILDHFVPVPPAAMFLWGALHTPIGAANLCVLLSLLFAPEDRGRVFLGLLAGVGLHFLTDVFQFHHGQGYTLLFPFSPARFELGWIDSEATVPWAPAIVAATILAWMVRIAWDRRRRVENPPPAV